MQTVVSLLNQALELKGWSIQRLKDESKIKTDRSNLRRKLKGDETGKRAGKLVALDPEEANQLATALGVSIPPDLMTRDLMAGRVTRCRTANGWVSPRARKADA